ncbi:uncharacterized protein LOC144859477 isoform X1 [Branchiostoma floridae x Branchiostoma japonicum]
MSEGPSAAQDSAVGQEENVHRHSEAHQGDSRPHASMSGQRRSSGELEFHSPAESEDDTDSSNRDDERPQVGIAPPLGQHEKYHVFFCYSSADAPWVKNMIQKLESDELGFKCCFHERDFIPGKAIIENIVRCIQRSRKTVFVLSRDFVDSRWCNFERQMVMRRHLSEGEKLVIPVMLRECALPEFIQHMTYLEEWTPYFFDNFIAALKESTSDDPSSQSDSFSMFTYNSNFINGEQVLKVEAECACFPPCARFDEQIVPPELVSRGIRIPRSDYFMVISKVMGMAKMRFYTCCFSESCFWVSAILSTLVLYGVLQGIIPSIRLDAGEVTVNAVLEVFVPIGLFLLVAIPFRCISHYKNKKTMKTTLLEVNTILVKSHIIASVTDQWSCIARPVLNFVYYETGPCLMQILEDLMTRASLDTSSVTGDYQRDSERPDPEDISSSVVSMGMDDEAPLLSDVGSGDEDSSPHTSRMSELKTEAEALLLKYSDEYVWLLVTKKLPQPGQSRGHTQQGACLCQLVELREFGWKLDREQTLVV